MASHHSPLVRLGNGVRALAYGSPFYNLSLGGKTVKALAAVPLDPWPGKADRGKEILSGNFIFAGQSCQVQGDPLTEKYWFPKGATPGWHHELHTFDWLRDLRALGGDDARRHARTLIIGWLEWNALWTEISWRTDLLGPRIANWVATHDFFWASADESFRYCVFDSLARQTRHLARVIADRLSGPQLIVGIKGLVYGSLCLDPGEPVRALALRLLEDELPRQILPDGGHAERSPTRQLIVLRHLIDIRAALRAARAKVPELVQAAIDRMIPMLRFFRHGDGGLAVFNGGREEDRTVIDTVLAQVESRGRPLRSAPHTGYERLAGGRAVVLIDVGAPPPPGSDPRAHAGLLSFEASVGKDRIIVNCGCHPRLAGPWREAFAASAAHSTVIVGETNAIEVLPDGGVGRRPGQVANERIELDDATMVVASHNGYARGFCLRHRRRLWLSQTGDDLRGEDILEPAYGARTESRDFIIRFHLHPAVDAAVEETGDTVRLTLPSGATWHLRAPGKPLELGESVYFGTGDEPTRSVQVMLGGTTGALGVTVKWALQRSDDGA